MVTVKRSMALKRILGEWTMAKLSLLLLMIVLLFCGALPASVFAAGGDYVWTPYNVAAAGKQEAKASKTDSQGNLIIVGYTDSNGNDFHVVKVKADGTGTDWSVTKDASGGADVATAVVVDSNDDVIVTGYLWDGPTYNDIYTAKYSGTDGSLIWEHTFDGTGSGNDYPTAITVDAVGNVYVAGYMQAPSTKDSFILLKYDPNNGPNQDGTALWEIAYDAGNDGHDRAYAVVADDVHGVAITGESQNATPDFDCLTVRYDTSGNQVWVRRYSDTGDGRGEALAMDADGNVVMAGYISNGSDTDFYVIEYPAADVPPVWSSIYIYDSGMSDHATALWLDGDDNVYAVGDDATLTTGSDIHAVKLNGTTGATVWSQSYNSSGGHNDMAKGLAGDSNGELFIVGYKNDGVGGLDDVLAMKVKKDDGTQLWLKEYDGNLKNDRSLCACLGPDGNLLVGGWSDRWTAGSSDYDFLALKFESGALNQPTTLAATVVSNTQIDLTWNDNSSGEDNFVLERKIGANGTYSVIATLAANTVSYSDTGLTPDTRYYYRVMATSAATGNTPYSNEVDVKTTIISYAAPSLQFQYGAPAAGDDFAEAIAVGADNHPVVTGFITGGVTSFDYYTIKLDRADLTEQWNATYNDGDNEVDVATAVTVDSSNRVVVSGYSSLYGGGAGNTNDVYTIGYPADGSTESWTDQYNGPDGNDDRSSAVASAIDGSDNTAVVGYGKNAAFDDDIYVLKFAADGTRQWAITPFDGGGNDYPAAVAFDSDGNVLVGGYTENVSNKDFFVAKYNGSTGAQIWQKSFNGVADADDFVNALAVDASGNLYVTGSSVNASGNSDIYTIKYAAADGTLLWQKSFDGVGNGYDIGEGITFDPVDGSIMVGGTTFVGAGNHDYHLIRYDAAGNVVWEKTLDRPGSDEALYAMSIDRSGTVSLTGTTNSGANDDVLTVKYDSDGIILGASVYNGAADSDDAPSSIATNAYGETFVAGITSTASGDTDYMVFLAAGQTMQSPTPFTATQLYTEVNLSWTDNSLDESGFNLERKTGTCDSGNPWTPLSDAAANAESYMNTGLSVGSTFCYRIRSYNASGESSRWAELEVTTAEPVAPSGLTATVQNTTEILLEWTDNTGSEDGFTLERCLGAACDFSTPTSINVAANATSYTDTSVCAGQTYSYRIKSYKTNEWATAVSNVAADALTDSPVAPTDFAVSLVSEIETSMSWTDNSDDETGFKIERCDGSGCSDFAEVGSVAANAVSYNDSGLQPNTLYRYRVTPYKTATCSVDPAYATIQEITTTPAAPSSLNGSALFSTQVNLSWADNTASEDGVKIERCQGAACSSFSQIATTAANVTRYVDDTVCSGETYRYQVRSYKSGLWDSAYSSIVEVTVGTPPLPADFAVTAVSEEGIDLNWNVSGVDPQGFIIERCSGASCVDVAQLSDVPSGRDLYLPFEEVSWSGSADEVVDQSGNDNHGTSHGGANIDQTGQVGWAGNFNGSSAYLTTALTTNQASDGPGLTFEVWAYPESTNNAWRGLVSTENGGYDWSLMQYGATWRIYTGASTWSASTVTANTWQHLVVVFEPGVGIRFYKNGNMTSTAGIGYDTGTNPVNIGRRANGSYYFDGKLDEVMVYNRALTHAEVLARYNTGSPQSGIFAEIYSDTGLSPSTTYGYRIHSYRADDCAGATPAESSTTAILYATTLTPPPPTGLALSIPNTTQVDLSWADNTDSETGFIIERCTGSGTACDEDVEFSLLTTTAADTTSYSDLTACSATTYTYRVAAEKTDGPVWQTTWNVSASGTTGTPVTPADFSATAVSEVQVDLAWSDSLSDEDSYRLEKCVGSGADCDEDVEFSLLQQYDNRSLPNEAVMWLKMDEASWGAVVNSGTAGSDGTKYGQAAIQTDIDGRASVGWFDGSADYLRFDNYAELNPSAALTIATWAKSFNATWQHDHALISKRNAYMLSPRASDTGMRFYAYLNSGFRVIDVAGSVIATALGGSFDITEWHHYAGTYDGANLILYVDGIEVGRTAYVGTFNGDTGILEIAKDDGYARYHKGWMDDLMIFGRALSPTEVAALTVLVGDISYQDQGLSPSTTYTYRLRASKTASCSWNTGWSVQAATTMDPPPPTDFAVAATDTTTLDISWTDNSGSETAYNLERCTGSGTACDEDVEFSALDATLAPDTVSYTDSTVCESGSYTYRVRAEKDDGPTWQTSWAGPTTQTAVSKADPTVLTATPVSEVQINLSWTDTNSDETGFKIERCAGAGCSSFVEVATAAAGASSYQDDQLDPNTSYSYRIKAYKTADCAWESNYTNTASGTTTITAPSGLAASSVNTTRIDLAWTDNTATETATVIERCTGSGCSDFAEIDAAGTDLSSYSDNSVCYGTTYNYRIKAKNDGLSGSGCWTRRAPLSFTAFSSDTLTSITVPYDADMRSDFGDLRFYDEDGQRSLNYYIQSKTDGVSATILLGLQGSSNINMYYGNASASDAGNENVYLLFEDDFQGTSIDTSKWVEIDPNNSIGQNDDLLLVDVSDAWNKALISQETFDRVAGREFYYSLTIAADTAGSNHFMAGWELDQTSNASYNQLVHGLFWSNYAFNTYEKATSTGASGSYTPSTSYEAKVVLKDVGAKYYVKGGAYGSWTLAKETSDLSDATMRVAFTQYSHQANIHLVQVRDVAADTGASLGAEESDACYAYGNTWESGYSNQDEATTSSPVAPSGLTAVAVSDSQIDLSWTDNTDVESGFKIERCTGSGCSDFAQIDTVAGGVTSYSDLSAAASVENSYRVRAYKSSSCAWDSGYSNTAGDLSFPAASTNLTATAVNSRMIQLDWDDNASDEDGYEVEALIASGKYVKIADLPADTSSFVDSMLVESETEYTYRVRPYRGVDISPYSNSASATTPAYTEGDGTCPIP